MFGGLGAAFNRMGAASGRVPTLANFIFLSATSINENSTVGTTLGTASISGSYTGTPTWSLTNSASGTFAIDSSTGAVTVANNTALDYETNMTLQITISVAGVSPAVSSQDVTVTVLNVIETPTNTALPTISGTAAVGSTLTISNGTWTDMSSGTFAYQWKRSGSSIGGATAASYTLVHADAGNPITCTVTATNSAGNASATTSATSNVTEPPSNTVAPSISGTAQVGSTLTASAGTWNGYPAPTPTYQWNANGVAIGGATASTYTPVSGDIGKTITVTVTETNSSGSASATSAATSAVIAGGTIALSANQDIQGAVQGTAIGTISGGTGPYTVTDATNTTQVSGGTALQVGSVAPSVGAVTITLHDTGVPAAPDKTFTINTVPQAPSLDLIAASDTGSSSTDNITSNNSPNIDITFPTTPVAGDVVEIQDNGATVVTHTITAPEISGSTIDLGLSALSDGVHSLTARHTKTVSAVNYTSAWSSALNVTIDTTGATLSSPTGAQDGTIDTQADLSVTTNEGSGTLYWIISTSATAPSVAQIQAGNDSSGSSAYKSGSAAVTSTGVKSVNVSGMASNTYYAYFQQNDVAGNNSAVAASTSWTQTVAGGGYVPTFYFLGF